MMNRFKIIAILIAVLCPFGSAIAKDDAPGGPLACDTVMVAEGLAADQIYDNLKVWFADNMRSANDVIQLDDAANKHIIGKACIEMKVNNFTWSNLSGFIRFTIDVAARDGRYRVKLYGFNHEALRDGWTEGPVYVNGPNPKIKGLRKKQNSEMQKRAAPLCVDKIALILTTMQESMRPGTSITNDDW